MGLEISGALINLLAHQDGPLGEGTEGRARACIAVVTSAESHASPSVCDGHHHGDGPAGIQGHC